jgi:uncharacterized protein YyaL (SSP411 family)
MSDEHGTRSPRAPNRLAAQASPYLLQHAHNPVDWHPWGPEAFAEARRRDVPIFLSIGYSTCYWCHVMERESFENDRIGALLSERFVCVKVDREERPDIDDLYMTATQLMTGHGGWPMTVFLDPATLRPFWCGTYFPPEPRPGMNTPALPQVIEGISRAWSEQRTEVTEQAAELAGAVQRQLGAVAEPFRIGAAQVSQAAGELLKSFDRSHGGFGGAPKFPQPAFLDFLLDVRTAAGDEATRAAVDASVRTTLDKMAIGGVYDQAGGGFHRYAVDNTWTVPHFEKMLYDNAQLVIAYAGAARAYGDGFYRAIVRETLDYILREMTSPAGGFSSAQDAEVGGREGLNYLWTIDQMREVLGSADADFAAKVYMLDKGPNFQDPHHPAEPPSNILRLADHPRAVAASLGLSVEAFHARLTRVNAKLLWARSKREQPRLDDKVLASWNGLAIAAFAAGHELTGDNRYRDAATAAADFLLASMMPGGILLRSWRNNTPGPRAFLEDHAAVIQGMIALHRTLNIPDSRYLAAARHLRDRAIADFADPATGAFFDTRADQPDLFARPRSTQDGAIPSPSSIMLGALLDLHEITHDDADKALALGILRSLSPAIAESPRSAISATRSLLRLLRAGAGSELTQGATPPPAASAPRDSFTPVEIYASVDRVVVTEEAPALLTLAINIAPAYHIYAADPAPSDAKKARSLVPLRVGIVHGSGIAAYADNPSGDPWPADPAIMIHKGAFELAIALERTGAITGHPLVSITYQACTDTECLEPTTVELDVAID